MHSVRLSIRSEEHLSYDRAQEWLDTARGNAVKALPHQANHSNHHYSSVLTLTPRITETGSPAIDDQALPTSNRSKYVDAGIQYSPPRRKTQYVTESIRIQQHNDQSSSNTHPINDVTLSSGHTFAIPGESVHLSDEQRRVLHRVERGNNVFFTGPAGTGKSVLLREIIVYARNRYSSNAVAVTASTGIAGLNIGGSTVHSFAGIGLGKEPAEKLATKIAGSRRLKERWIDTKILIIDEISMLDGTLFDKLEYIARFVRGTNKPFGGIQLVISGDFFQLPPVPDQSHDYRMPATFAFDGQTWSTCIARPMFLTQVFRQKNNVFVDILSSIRQGIMTPEHIELLQGLSRSVQYPDGIEPCQLFPLRREVEKCNNQRLSELVDPMYKYLSVDSTGYDVNNQIIPIDSARNLLDRLIAPSCITLRVGAQVMLIQNIQQGSLVNGSVGKVIGFLTIHEALEHNISIAEINDRREQAQRNNAQIIRDVTQNLKPECAAGMRPINDHVFSHKQSWPLVRFTNERELLCAPLAFTVEGFRGNVEAHRIQVPLILAWALSIHKSQGQTLTRVKVDLGQVFEKGQAYVALSRATTMEGLEVENFQPSKVTAHPRVLAWQRFWTLPGDDDEAMDSEEAVRSFWEISD